MSEFCNSCPLRGSATGELDGILCAQVTASSFLGPTRNIGFAGVLVDEKGGHSKPLYLPATEEGRQRLFNAVENCEEPEIQEKGIFKKREVVSGCPALGRLAITDSSLKAHISRLASIETIGYSSKIN